MLFFNFCNAFLIFPENKFSKLKKKLKYSFSGSIEQTGQTGSWKKWHSYNGDFFKQMTARKGLR